MTELVRVSGVELAYQTGGSGPPLVLVHGSWTDRHGWDRVVPGLEQEFTVVRYDRRGHSESEQAAGTTLDDVDDLAGLIGELDLAPAHLACSSYGGVIGLRLAASRPELLRSVVSHEPPLLGLVPDDPEARQAMEEVNGPGGVVAQIEAGDAEGAARRFVEEIAFGPGAWEQFPAPLRATFARNADTFAEEERDPESRRLDLDALRGFDRPVLLSQGGASPGVYGSVIELLLGVLPRVSRHTYPGAGHGPQATHPDEYVEVVGEFLRKADLE